MLVSSLSQAGPKRTLRSSRILHPRGAGVGLRAIAELAAEAAQQRPVAAQLQLGVAVTSAKWARDAPFTTKLAPDKAKKLGVTARLLNQSFAQAARPDSGPATAAREQEVAAVERLGGDAGGGAVVPASEMRSGGLPGHGVVGNLQTFDLNVTVQAVCLIDGVGRQRRHP
jgi:hypothetical protein